MITSHAKDFIQFLFGIHFHVVVLFLIFANPSSNTNEIYQYLAAYTLMVFLSFFLLGVVGSVFEERDVLKRILKGVIYVLALIGMLAGFLLFFYLDGRTDLYAIVLYAGVFTTAKFFLEHFKPELTRENFPEVLQHVLVGLSISSVWGLIDKFYAVEEYSLVLILTVLFATIYIWNELVFLLMKLISKKVMIALFFPFFLLGIPFTLISILS